MEIRIKGNTYEAPDCCLIDGPKKSTLKRHLSQHGVTSRLYVLTIALPYS